jgi:hypothetical protein
VLGNSCGEVLTEIQVGRADKLGELLRPILLITIPPSNPGRPVLAAAGLSWGGTSGGVSQAVMISMQMRVLAACAQLALGLLAWLVVLTAVAVAAVVLTESTCAAGAPAPSGRKAVVQDVGCACRRHRVRPLDGADLALVMSAAAGSDGRVATR